MQPTVISADLPPRCSQPNPSLLVIVPCLNEAATIASVVHRIPRNIPSIDRVDVLVIDDGSEDDTARIAKAAGAAVLRHPINKGVGSSFHTGIAYAIDHKYAFVANI